MQDTHIFMEFIPVQAVLYISDYPFFLSDKVIAEVQITVTSGRNRLLGGFSGGMKQRLGIAQALLNDPKLLIVDEPTTGLDPEERVRFRQLLADLAGERIVILSTHIVSDVEAAATEVAILDKGRLLWHSSPEDLLRSVEGRVWEWVAPSSQLAAIRVRYPISSAVRRGDGVHLRLVATEAPGPDARPVPPALEDAYLHHVTSRREGEQR